MKKFGSVQGYVALPPKKSGPALILLQEWWGINENIKDIADRFASFGYVVFAPDLFEGKVLTEPSEGEREMMRLKAPEVAAKLLAAIAALQNEEMVSPKRVGVLGFCMGGQLALYTASISKNIAACVDFYGVHPKFEPKYANICCPVLAFFGGKDTFVTPAHVEQLDQKLHDNGVSHTFVTYEHAGHAFFNESRKEAYDKDAAEDALKLVKGFLKLNLSE